MDGSVNPYLLQAGIIAAGLEGINKRMDPGEPLMVNMYEKAKDYPHLKKLPNELESAISELENSKELKEAFGENTINSYIKLKSKEIREFSRHDIFDKKGSITDWEKINTLDC